MDKSEKNRKRHSATELYAEVLASLEPDQLVLAKTRSCPRRNLKKSEVLLLFSLRLYLFVMIALIIYQVLMNAR